MKNNTLSDSIIPGPYFYEEGEKMKSRRILSIILAMISVILLFSVTASALTWDGSSAGGSTSAVNGSNSGYVIRSTIDDQCVVGYRFSVVDRAGDMKVNKVIDVYRNNVNGNYAYSTSAKFSKKYNKKQLIENKNATLKTTENTTNCYKETDMGFVSKLPNPAGVETWQKYETNINKVLTKIGVGSVDNMVYGDKVIIEPVFDVCLAGEYQALTVTEIAYCGRSVLGGSSDGGKTTGNSSTWGFIANYTNRIWPNKLYTPDGQDLWPGVSAIASGAKATFNTILTKGYGAGIAYSETLRITYTIAFKGNGATSGSTASMSMVYGKAKNLTANGFKKSGYTFSGWNRKADGSGTKYADKASVKDLTSKLDATVSLYAQWKPIKYTVHFNGNGSSSGTMSDLSMTYDTAKALTANAFKKTGYTFDSWNKKADGSGSEYANKESVKNLSSTSGATVNLYAQWNPVKYYVEFHGNGSTSGSMSNETFKYDSVKALTANAYKRSFTVTYNYNGSGKDNTEAVANASFSGWAKSSDGAKKYDNKESVKNLTSTSGATVDLYAKWTDASVKLPSPTRTGYVFSGWYTAASGGTKIGNGGASYTPSKNITLYAHWTPITYTIKFNGNGSTSGSMSNLSMTYDDAKALTANAFKKTGYSFVSWNTKSDGSGTKYTNKQSVKNLSTTNGATVNLYAQWTPITYYVKFNGNGSTSGSMSDEAFKYDTAKALTANAFKREFIVTYNYNGNGNDNTTAAAKATFSGWAESSGGAKKYDNKESVKNLTSTSGATVDLYAKWTDASVTLPSPTRTGYVFSGWYTAASGGTKIGNGRASYTPAKNITLYAHWTPVTYTIKFNGNSSTSGTMANMSMTYDVAGNLTDNAFKRTGYSFTGWNTKADGSGTKYTNKQSVKNLTTTNGATITLYAQWTPNAYTIRFNGNGSTSGSMNSMSMTYDTAKALTANAFKKTGYTFKNWNTKADGSGTSYSDKQTVKNLTSSSGNIIDLYAQWTPITYTIKFNGNSSTSGTMSNLSMTYDEAKALTVNAFKKTGYSFVSWNTKADGSGTKYTNKQSVKNLTATNGATINLYAQWTPTTYTIKFNGNGSTSGTMSNLSMKYDEAKSLTANAFKKIGYIFKNWNIKADGSGTSYSDKQTVKNLTTSSGNIVDLYAQWNPVSYSVKFNGNGSTSGSMANQSFTYDKAQALTANTFKREFTVTYNYNYYGSSLTSVTAKASFSGWASSSTGAVVYTDKQSVKNLSSTSGAVVNVYAKWTDKSVTLPTPTRTGYTFDEWYTDTTGGTKVGTGGGSYTPSKSVTLYAHWTPITYTVKFNGNGSTSGSMSNMSMTYDTAKTLTANSFKKTGYSFTGWNTKADGSGTSYTDRQSVKNLTSTNGAVINLYAKWTPITYKIHFIGNGATSGSMSDMTLTYDTAKALTANAFVNGSYDFLGWNTKTDGSGTAYTDKQSVKNLTAVSGTVINLYAQWDDGTKLFLEAVMPNASYRENTDVVTSFNIINKGADGCVPNDSVSVVFKVYRNSTVIKTVTQNNIVVPGNGKNLLYFKWTVPDGITAEKLYISAEIHEGGKTYGMVKNEYTICKYIVYSTPDTQYAASAPSGFTVPAVPAETSETAKWSVWVYEDGAFRKVNYGIKISGSAPVITPDASANASQSDGIWVMKSGYGYGISLSNGVNTISGYTEAPSSAYTDLQYALGLFPEFGYTVSADNCRTLELVSGKWSFRQNGDYGRIHFTPLWYPDGPYTAGVLQSDCWTPAGMIQRKTNTNTITISGSAYDDWYIG